MFCEAAGSSAPSGYSGSAFTNIPALGSLPAHAIDVNRSAPGETALFTGQVLLPVTQHDIAVVGGRQSL